MDRQHAERVYFEQLKRTVSIEAVLARYGIELRGSASSRKGCCPIHKGSNATQFVVDANKGLWRCFGDCKSWRQHSRVRCRHGERRRARCRSLDRALVRDPERKHVQPATQAKET